MSAHLLRRGSYPFCRIRAVAGTCSRAALRTAAAHPANRLLTVIRQTARTHTTPHAHVNA